MPVDFQCRTSGGEVCTERMRGDQLLFVEQINESFFVLGRLGVFFGDDALGRREADALASATARFRGNFQARLLSASHLASFH